MSGKVYIVGVGSTALGRFPDKSVKELTREAVTSALADAGADMTDIEAAWFSNTRQGMMENQNTIRGQCALRSMGFETIPIINVENACCSSSTGLNQAFAQIKAGLCEVALVVGAEKMFYPDKKDLMFKAFLGGWDVHDMERTQEAPARSRRRPAAAAGSARRHRPAQRVHGHLRLAGAPAHAPPRHHAAPDRGGGVQEPFPRDHESAGAISHRHVGRRSPQRQADLPGR